MSEILRRAEELQEKAKSIIGELNIIKIWESHGATINLVGSLRMGLMLKNRDIDFHIYSDDFKISDSFAALAEIAQCKGIKKIVYANLLDAREKCIEWEVTYEDNEKNEWQIDMIHILKDSQYAGKFERVAERIAAALTKETKEVILAIRERVPADKNVMGIEIYKAVLADGVRTYADFMIWRSMQKASGILEWEPSITEPPGTTEPDGQVT